MCFTKFIMIITVKKLSLTQRLNVKKSALYLTFESVLMLLPLLLELIMNHVFDL